MNISLPLQPSTPNNNKQFYNKAKKSLLGGQQSQDTFVKSNVSFKAVSINSSSLEKLTSQSGLTNQIEKIKGMMQNGAFKSLEELEGAYQTITTNIGIKRTAVKNRPWYKSVGNDGRYKALTQEELAAKEQVLSAKAIAVDRAKKEADEIEKLAKDVIAEYNDNRNAKGIERRKETELSDKVRGSFKSMNGFSKIAGYDEEKEILRTYFINEINKEKMGLKANVPGSVLFFGPTGNGKSTFARAFAKETGCNFNIIRNIPMDNNISESVMYKRFLADLIAMAENAEKDFKATNKRTVIFMDEITKVTNKDSTILKELDTFLADCSEKYHCTLFAATNYPSEIALTMNGSKAIFPYRVALEPPNFNNKAEVLKLYAQGRTEPNVDFKALVREMQERETFTGQAFSIAQIRHLIGYTHLNKTMSQSDISEIIQNTIPAIDKEHLAAFNAEINSLIQNKVTK